MSKRKLKPFFAHVTIISGQYEFGGEALLRAESEAEASRFLEAIADIENEQLYYRVSPWAKYVTDVEADSDGDPQTEFSWFTHGGREEAVRIGTIRQITEDEAKVIVKLVTSTWLDEEFSVLFKAIREGVTA